MRYLSPFLPGYPIFSPTACDPLDRGRFFFRIGIVSLLPLPTVLDKPIHRGLRAAGPSPLPFVGGIRADPLFSGTHNTGASPPATSRSSGRSPTFFFEDCPPPAFPNADDAVHFFPPPQRDSLFPIGMKDSYPPLLELVGELPFSRCGDPSLASRHGPF